MYMHVYIYITVQMVCLSLEKPHKCDLRSQASWSAQSAWRLLAPSVPPRPAFWEFIHGFGFTGLGMSGLGFRGLGPKGSM